MNRNMVTAFFSIAGGRLLVLLSSVFLTPLLINVMGFEMYGRYGTLLAVFGLVTILMSSGINSGARKYLAEERGLTDWQANVFGYYFRLATVLAVLTALAFVAAAYFGIVERYLGEQYVLGFYLLAALALATQFREYSRRALMGLKLEHVSEPLRVVNKVGTRVVAISLAALGFGIAGVLAGLTVVNAIVFVVALFFVSRNLSVGAVASRTPPEFPNEELFNFNHLSIVYIFLLTSLYHVDVLMLAGTVSETQVGYYKSALVISQFLWFVPRSIQSVMVQSTSNLWAEGRTEQITEIASRVTRYGLLVVLLLAIGLGSLAGDFVPIYLGEGSMPVVTPLLVLLPGTVGFAVTRPILAISHSKGDMKPLIIATGTAATINLVLNLTLIPRFGIVGAAAATTVGYGSLPLVQYAAARNLGYDPFADARLVRVALTGLVAGPVVYFLAQTIQSQWLALALVPPVGFIVYVLVAFLVGALEVDETLGVMESLPGPIGARAASMRNGGGNGGATGNGGVSAGRYATPTSSSTTSGGLAAGNANNQTVQRILLVLGILLAVSGVVVALDVPGTPDIGPQSSDPVGNLTETQTPASTPTPTAADTPTATSTTDTPSGTTTTDDGGFFGGNDTTTTAGTTTAGTTTTEDDGGFFGGDDTTTTTTTTETTSTPAGTTTTEDPFGTETTTATTTETTTATTTETTTATTTETTTATTTETTSSTTTEDPFGTETTTETTTAGSTTTTETTNTTTQTTTSANSTTTDDGGDLFALTRPAFASGFSWFDPTRSPVGFQAALGSAALLMLRRKRA